MLMLLLLTLTLTLLLLTLLSLTVKLKTAHAFFFEHGVRIGFLCEGVFEVFFVGREFFELAVGSGQLRLFLRKHSLKERVQLIDLPSQLQLELADLLNRSVTEHQFCGGSHLLVEEVVLLVVVALGEFLVNRVHHGALEKLQVSHMRLHREGADLVII